MLSKSFGPRAGSMPCIVTPSFAGELRAVAHLLLDPLEKQVIEQTVLVAVKQSALPSIAESLKLTLDKLIQIRDEALYKLRRFVGANYPSIARFFERRQDMLPTIS